MLYRLLFSLHSENLYPRSVVDLIKARGIEPGIVQELPSMLEKIMNVRDIHSRTVTTRMLDGTKLGQLAWQVVVHLHGSRCTT